MERGKGPLTLTLSPRAGRGEEPTGVVNFPHVRTNQLPVRCHSPSPRRRGEGGGEGREFERCPRRWFLKGSRPCDYRPCLRTSGASVMERGKGPLTLTLSPRAGRGEEKREREGVLLIFHVPES